MSPLLQLLPALLLACTCPTLLRAQAGPYKPIVVTDVFSCCDDAGDLDIRLLMETKRVKKGYIGRGNMTTGMSIDETVSAKILIQKCDNSGCNDYNEIETDNACGNALENIPEIMDKLATAIGLPCECPVPTGTYSCEDMSLTMPMLEKYDSLPYGDFKLCIELFKDEKKVACFGGRGLVEEVAHET